jgi:DNA invertase Pin-like site-specific DNA recombinase
VSAAKNSGNSSRSGVFPQPVNRLLTAVGRGEVGAVFAIEASRLARNGRDWHTLLEFCAIVGTLIIDEDGITIRDRVMTK